MKNEVLFSSASDEYGTPQEVFDKLNEEFRFTIDVCATAENRKCERFYSKEHDGLMESWGGETVFCNPPYSQIAKWVRKAYHEGCANNTTVVMLIPSRTDTRWFHNYILYRSEIRFIKGRLKFGNKTENAPFPSMIVIFRGAKE